MEGISLTVLLVPIIQPIAQQMGIDMVYLGVVLTFNTMLGLLTPPVGLSLYAVSMVSGVPLRKIIGEIWPFLISLFIVLILITYIPGIILFLPNLLFSR